MRQSGFGKRKVKRGERTPDCEGGDQLLFVPFPHATRACSSGGLASSHARIHPTQTILKDMKSDQSVLRYDQDPPMDSCLVRGHNTVTEAPCHFHACHLLQTRPLGRNSATLGLCCHLVSILSFLPVHVVLRSSQPSLRLQRCLWLSSSPRYVGQ